MNVIEAGRHCPGGDGDDWFVVWIVEMVMLLLPPPLLLLLLVIRGWRTWRRMMMMMLMLEWFCNLLDEPSHSVSTCSTDMIAFAWVE